MNAAISVANCDYFTSNHQVVFHFIKCKLCHSILLRSESGFAIEITFVPRSQVIPKIFENCVCVCVACTMNTYFIFLVAGRDDKPVQYFKHNQERRCVLLKCVLIETRVIAKHHGILIENLAEFYFYRRTGNIEVQTANITIFFKRCVPVFLVVVAFQQRRICVCLWFSVPLVFHLTFVFQIFPYVPFFRFIFSLHFFTSLQI